MKKVLALILALCMMLTVAACGSTPAASTPADKPADAPAASTPADEPADEPAAPAVEPYQFNISYGGTPGSSMVAVMESLQAIMTEKSGGAVTFNVYNDNGYKEKQALDELMNDIVDIVYLASGSTSGTVTEVAYLGMPGCFRYSDNAEEFFAFEESVAPIMSDIYEGYGIHYLGLRVPAKMAIVGTGAAPLQSADLNGKVVRVSGTWLGRLAVSMDIATANVGLSELATALQRKTVDSCITGIEQVYAQMLGEVVDYACVLPETDGIGALVMDNECWAKLTDAQKACVEESVAAWMEECLKVSNTFYTQSIEALEANEVEVVYYDDAQCDEFLKTLPAVYEEIDAQTTENGHALRDAILAFRGQ